MRLGSIVFVKGLETMGAMREREEIYEAIAAADDALFYLRKAQECLGSAGSWGIVDMLGGGFLTTMIKHSRINKAQVELENARDALHRFSRELSDLSFDEEIKMEIGDFLLFADYFFDGLIADWMAQSRIQEARGQVSSAIDRVSAIRDALKERC